MEAARCRASPDPLMEKDASPDQLHDDDSEKVLLSPCIKCVEYLRSLFLSESVHAKKVYFTFILCPPRHPPLPMGKTACLFSCHRLSGVFYALTNTPL